MEKNKQQTDIITDNFVSDIRTIIEQGRKQAYAATGQIAIMTYWNIGRRIVEEEQQGASRAAYGQKLIPALAVRLAAEYGTGYGKRNLAYYRKFYLEFKDVEILHTRVQNLTWSHVRRLLSVSNTQAREWYLKTAAEDMWSVDDLDRNISTQYYERRLAAQRESSTLPVPYAGQTDPLEYIKNPMVAEFMGFRRDTSYSESELEQALIDNLEKFIMELLCKPLHKSSSMKRCKRLMSSCSRSVSRKCSPWGIPRNSRIYGSRMISLGSTRPGSVREISSFTAFLSRLASKRS